MPEGIDEGRIAAELANGVLRLHLPKSAASKPREIPVHVG
jgi:HSP20 family molecular chaperone IbpA